MPRTIIQKIKFNTTINKLYNFYMDAKLHSEIIEDKAKISKEVGSNMNAYGNYCKGKILHLKPNTQIIQTWRASDWVKEDIDSTLILTFKKNEDETSTLEMVHANVPDNQFEDLKKGCKEHYWNKWKMYIKNKG